MTEQEFVAALLRLDAVTLRPYGLTLGVSQTEDGWTAMIMKHSDSRKLCTAFEFLPEKPRVRRFSRLSQYGRDEQPGLVAMAA